MWVTGKRPESSLDRKLYNKPLISPNKYVVGISDGLNRAILKGMNLEAENRPQSMGQWLKLLLAAKDVNSGNNVFHITNKTEERTVKTDKTYPVIVNSNNPIKARGKSKNIPWFWLGIMSLFYLMTGFVLASNRVNTTQLSITLCVALFLAYSPTYFYKRFVDVIFIFYCYPLFIISGVYFFSREKLEKYFSKLHTSLIVLGNSWLSIFLGWLIYQILPIFGHR
jgi:hypothetical protein